MMRARVTLPLLALAALAAGCGSSTHTTSAASATTPTTATTTAATTKAGHHGGPIVTKLPGTAGQKGSLATLGKLPRVRPQTVRSHLTGFTGETVPDKLTSYAADVASVWNFEFSNLGPTQLPPATVTIIDQTPASCGSAQVGPDSSPQYCAAAQSVDLPVATLTSQIAPLGDAALLLVVSDLYGYHVENALGLLNTMSPSQLTILDSCLSGVYFTEARNHLQSADETSVNKFLALQAAPASTGSGGATPVTAAALTTAFNKGLMTNGYYTGCLPSSGTTSTT
jgi:hypothetical protein